MTKAQIKEAILSAKKRAGVSWAQLSESLGLGSVYLASCCYGENSMSRESAEKLGAALALPSEVVEALQAFPTKGGSFGDKSIPTDPLVYRFYEIMVVYGAAM